MVIRCPHCSTGFRLPADKVGSKGTKVRCSKCSHTFRVRIGDDGDPEIFGEQEAQRDLGPPSDPKTQELGDLFDDDGFDDGFDDGSDEEEAANNRTQLGTMGAAISHAADGDGDEEEDANNRTQLGRPSYHTPAARSRSGSAGYNPFPLAGIGGGGGGAKTATTAASPAPNAFDDIEETVVTEPPSEQTAKAAPGIAQADDDGATLEMDSFQRESLAESSVPDELEPQAPSSATASSSDDAFDAALDDALEGAFGGFDDAPSPAAAAAAAGGAQVTADRANAAAAARQQAAASTNSPADDDLAPPDPEELVGGDDSFFMGQKASPYGSAEDFASPDFGADGPAFDPETGTVTGNDASNGASGPGVVRAQSPREAARQAAARQAAARRSTPAAAAPVAAAAATPAPVATAPPEPASWDVEPHTIGGSGGSKFVALLLMLLIVGAGFIGVVAFLNDGMVDFKNFPHMLEVAFEGKDYEPRPEWAPAPPPAPAAPEVEPLQTREVFAYLTEVGKGRRSEPVLVVRGEIANGGEDRYGDLALRVLILDPTDKVLREQTVPAGTTLGAEGLKAANDANDAAAMVESKPEDLRPGAAQPFTAVFTDVPQAAQDGDPLRYRVEVARKRVVE